MRGLRFPVEEAEERLVGRAALEDFDRWWSVIRDLATRADAPEHVENLGCVLGAVLVERMELSEQVAGDALGDRRLTCVLAAAIDLAWLGASDRAHEGGRQIARLFGRDRVVRAYLDYLGSGWDLDFWRTRWSPGSSARSRRRPGRCCWTSSPRPRTRRPSR